jgi:hypothetical protein
MAVCGVIGLGWLVRRNWRPGLATVAFPVLHTIAILVQTSYRERFLLPLLPFLALGAGILVETGVARLSRGVSLSAWSRAAWVAGLTGALAVWPLFASMEADSALAGPDIRTEALEWYNAHISAEARVAADPTGPAFTSATHNLYLTWDLAQHTPQWYVENGVEYLVISEARLRDPILARAYLGGYDKLMSQFRLVMTFEGNMLARRGRHLWIYRVE